MKKLLYVFGLLTVIVSKAQENKDITYIRTHAILAVQEMEMYKIPLINEPNVQKSVRAGALT